MKPEVSCDAIALLRPYPKCRHDTNDTDMTYSI